MAVSEIPHMTYQQYRMARRLVRECCNYDCGNCLLLDDGEECICPQSITYSLICKWFRSAVLPLDACLCAALLYRADMKKCVLCGGSYMLQLKGRMTHRTALGADPRGNLTRIDNALSQMPQRLESVKVQLDNLYQQQAAAKEEVGKAFPYEEELRVKNARLVELNMDSKGQSRPEAAIAKRARPSVLEGLKRPLPPRSMEKKPRQQEQEAR